MVCWILTPYISVLLEVVSLKSLQIPSSGLIIFFCKEIEVRRGNETILSDVMLRLLNHRFDWKVTNWGPCQVRPLISQQDHRHGNSSFLCGGGIQTREAYCVRIFNDTTKPHSKNTTLCINPVRVRNAGLLHSAVSLCQFYDCRAISLMFREMAP